MSDDSTGAVVEDDSELGDLRSSFHHELDVIRAEIAKLSAKVTESIPRATEILLSQDLEGAEYIINADDCDHAVRLCKNHPNFRFGTIEVREVDFMGGPEE